MKPQSFMLMLHIWFLDCIDVFQVVHVRSRISESVGQDKTRRHLRLPRASRFISIIFCLRSKISYDELPLTMIDHGQWQCWTHLSELTFADQFAFRPAGSCTAAIIALLHTVSTMLLDNPYVIVITLDFSKAFDTVRHSTLAKKLSVLNIPDGVYNWIVDFWFALNTAQFLMGIFRQQ